MTASNRDPETDSLGTCRVFSRKIQIRSSDTDMYRQLRMSRLFSILQELSIAHTEALGFPRETTLDRGFLWVITRVRLCLPRPIFYDESIRIETWPEPMIHMVYPRGYRILDAQDRPIGECSALWTIIDGAARQVALPSRTGVVIAGFHREDELPLPQGLLSPAPDIARSARHPVSYSDIDLNRHVNNTRYFDWIDDLFAPEAHKCGLYSEIQMNFQHEIRPGTCVTLQKSISSAGDGTGSENESKPVNEPKPDRRILRVCGFTEEKRTAFTAEAVLR